MEALIKINKQSTFDITDIAKARHTTKGFDATKKISDTDVAKLKLLLRLAPSSTNVQPWYFVIAETPEGKARVAKATDEAWPFNSPKITEASLVVVFASRVEPDESFLSGILDKEQADGRFDADVEKLRGDTGRGRKLFLGAHQKADDVQHWMEKQVYLNMGQFLIGAASLGIDTTPMEGVDTGVLDEEFGLREKGYKSLAVVSLGYHGASDYNADLPKSRLPYDDILETV